MDIYKFLNSKDEAAYLKSIDFKFTPVQIAFMVYVSQRATYRQKIAAWQEIVDTMPDCEMPKRRNYWHEDNLHDFLKAVIAEHKRYEKQFYNEPDCVYAYKYADVDYDWQYSSLDALLNDLKEELNDEDLKYGYTVRKQKIDANIVWEAKFNKKHKLISVFCYGKDYISKETEPHDVGFEGLWFDIPTPFRKGDILINKWEYGGEDPFVLIELPNWSEEILNAQGEYDPEKIKRNKHIYDRHVEQGDITDMSSYALFADYDDGVVFHDHPMPYFDFEYYRGKLDGGYAALKVISNYLKKDYGLEYLLINYTNCVEKCKVDKDYFDLD